MPGKLQSLADHVVLLEPSGTREDSALGVSYWSCPSEVGAGQSLDSPD